MADAELRALEREVAATGDPAARLSLGQQLVRHGRRDDALRALWPIRGTAEGRRALAEWPAITPGHPDGGCWDTTSLRTRPRVRWQRPVTDAFQTRILLASPLGIACCPDRSRVAVLDPEGGAIRWARDVAVDERPRSLRSHATWPSPVFQDGAAAPGPPGPMAPERSALRAHALDGRLLWELREPDELPAALLCIAPLAGRLYGLGRDGSVLCLEA